MWHKQRFINSMTYLLDSLTTFDVSTIEAMVLIMVHHFNTYNEHITLERLSSCIHASVKDVDDAIDHLQRKGYLVIETHQGHIHFNVDACFHSTQPSMSKVSVTLHDTFEQSFKRLLSEKEYNMLSLWTTQYSEGLILNALRQALVNDKTNMAYIGKILENWKKANKSEKDFKHE